MLPCWVCNVTDVPLTAVGCDKRLWLLRRMLHGIGFHPEHGLQHPRSGCSVKQAPGRSDVARTMTWIGDLCRQHPLS